MTVHTEATAEAVRNLLAKIRDGHVDPYLKHITRQIYLRRDALEGTDSFTSSFAMDANGLVDLLDVESEGPVSDTAETDDSPRDHTITFTLPVNGEPMLWEEAFPGAWEPQMVVAEYRSIPARHTGGRKYFTLDGRMIDKDYVIGKVILLPSRIGPLGGNLARIDDVAKKNLTVTFLTLPKRSVGLRTIRSIRSQAVFTVGTWVLAPYLQPPPI